MEVFLRQMREKMSKAIDVTQTDISSIRSGRATPALVENIKIAAYAGSQILSLMELATITTSDSKTILIQPFDPSIIHEIAKGIMESKSGLSPSVDGEVIRISLPPLSEERRMEFIKLVRTKIEAGRVMVRQIRHDGMTQIRKMDQVKEITEDDRHHWEKNLQDITNEMISKLDSISKKKEEELLQI